MWTDFTLMRYQLQQTVVGGSHSASTSHSTSSGYSKFITSERYTQREINTIIIEEKCSVHKDWNI